MIELWSSIGLRILSVVVLMHSCSFNKSGEEKTSENLQRKHQHITHWKIICEKFYTTTVTVTAAREVPVKEDATACCLQYNYMRRAVKLIKGNNVFVLMSPRIKAYTWALQLYNSALFLIHSHIIKIFMLSIRCMYMLYIVGDHIL